MKEHKFTLWMWRQIYRVLSYKFDINIEYSSGKKVASTVRIYPTRDKLFIDYENKTVIIKRK